VLTSVLDELSLSLGAEIPTLFVIGADGLVSWNDNSSRPLHHSETLREQLTQAIEEALLTNRSSDSHSR
jgi:hypothetical protein